VGVGGVLHDLAHAAASDWQGYENGHGPVHDRFRFHVHSIPSITSSSNCSKLPKNFVQPYFALWQFAFCSGAKPECSMPGSLPQPEQGHHR
jgi:hypothetical protein